MLLTEKEVARAVGLPGAVVTELLYLGAGTYPNCGADAPQFDERDLKRAQLAVLMMNYGIRWHWVKEVMDGIPQTDDDLDRQLKFWKDLSPARPSQRLRDAVSVGALTATLTLLALLALLAALP